MDGGKVVRKVVRDSTFINQSIHQSWSRGIIVAVGFEEAGLDRHFVDHQEADGTQALPDREDRVLLAVAAADATHPGLIPRRRSCRASLRRRMRWRSPAHL